MVHIPKKLLISRGKGEGEVSVLAVNPAGVSAQTFLDPHEAIKAAEALITLAKAILDEEDADADRSSS